MEALINKEKSRLLTNTDIARIVGYPINVVPYHKIPSIADVRQYNSIDKLFGRYPCVVILYEQDELNTGHYCCLLKMNSGKQSGMIEFFDSYGVSLAGEPDEQELKFNELQENKKIIQDGNTILDLLKNSKYNYYANPWKLQSEHYKVATCGRWVASRIRFHQSTSPAGSSLVNFIKLFDVSDPDKLITSITLLGALD